MQFCSKYAYDYGFSGSDEEDISDEEGETQKKTTRRFRRADANIISVSFDKLVESNEMNQSLPISCKSCEAYMSALSKENIKKEGDIYKWTCEFCGEVNDVVFTQEGMPKSNDVTYIIEAAPIKSVSDEIKEAANDVVKSNDNNYLTFCMDISGSMDTHIQNAMTRLDGVKLACVENIELLKKEEPNKRVSLVTFSENVKFYGDCSKTVPIVNTNQSRLRGFNASPMQQSAGIFGSLKKKAANIFSVRPNTRSQARQQQSFPQQQQQSFPQQQQQSFVHVSGSSSSLSSNSSSSIDESDEIDVMNNKEKMLTLGANQDGDLKCITKSFDDIMKRVKNLRTEGATALGPGLVFSIGFSGKKSGSQIILCTDGCANVGMGSLSSYHQRGTNAETFYEQLADDAREKGVTVNVISMEGTDCKLALLGKVADKTNGSLNIVNPLELGEQFKSILKNRIVATDVKAKLIVNKKYLYVRDEQIEIAESKAIEAKDMAKKEELRKERKNFEIRDIGNANIDTEITFEYGIKKLSGKKEHELKELPFQLQITYTNEDGTKAVRVYTKNQKFSKDRELVEDNVIEQNILWTNAQQKMSSHFLSSNTVVAKYKGRQMKNLANRNSKFAAPERYQQQAVVLEKSKKTRTVNDLNDVEAQQMYSGKKMSRNKLT